MAHNQWDSESDLNDIISFALDFKKLQKILKSVLSGMDGMRLEITNLQEQQGKWEQTLLSKVNALEKQAHTQAPYEDTAHLKFTLEKLQRDHADEMMNVNNSLSALKEEMATLNSEVIQSMQVSNECKAAVFSTKNDLTSRIADLEKHVGQVTETTSNLTRDAKDFALKADLHASVQTISSRLTNTEKSIASEFGGFNSWKEKHEAMLRSTDDKVESMKGDLNMLKTITDELSPPEVKKAITNLSRELAKLRATVREQSDTPSLSSSTENPTSTAPRVSNQSLSELEALQKNMMDQLTEQARKHFDLRRDVSDLGTLLEALTTGIKGSDVQRGEYLKMLEDHSHQLSHLLRTKADISVIETIMVQPKPAAGLTDNEKDELSALRDIIKSKASKTELAKIRKKLDDGAYNLQHTHDGAMGGNLDASITRVHFRCLACDRLMTPNSNQQQEGTPPYFDLAPHVAYRRWRVKDMVKDAKGSAAVNNLVNSYSPPPSAGTSKRSLGPITPRGSRPKSASISNLNSSSSLPSSPMSNVSPLTSRSRVPQPPQQQQPVIEDYDDNDF